MSAERKENAKPRPPGHPKGQAPQGAQAQACEVALEQKLDDRQPLRDALLTLALAFEDPAINSSLDGDAKHTLDRIQFIGALMAAGVYGTHRECMEKWEALPKREYKGVQRVSFRDFFAWVTGVAHNQIPREANAISFLTDVEGDMPFLERVLHVDEVLKFNEDGNGELRLEWRPNMSKTGVLVYGGDTVDKQNGDRATVKALLDFYNRVNDPYRVVFLMGNRDINKLRLFKELPPKWDAPPPDPLDHSQVCYWDVNVYNFQKGRQEREAAPEKNSYGEFLKSKKLDNNWVSVLKWMLVCTMGSPTAFENRKTELNSERAVRDLVSEQKMSLLRANRAARKFRSQHIEVQGESQELLNDFAEFSKKMVELSQRPAQEQDEEVYNDYYVSMDPARPDHEAWMLSYLKKAVMGYINGPNVFMHGGVNKRNIGMVPGSPGRILDPHSWVAALNAWGQSRIDAFVQHGRLAYVGDLLDYSLPTVSNGCQRLAPEEISLVTCSWLKNGNAEKLSEDVERWLKRGKFNFLITGHQPHGDCPQIIRGEFGTVVMADTSYSDGMGRRLAYSAVNLYPDRLVVRGTLGTASAPKGQKGGVEEHGYTLYADNEINNKHPHSRYIGRQCNDEGWVKTVITGKEGEKELLVVRGEGFALYPRRVVANQLHNQVKVDGASAEL